MKRYSAACSLFVLFLASVTGCAAFKGSNLPDIEKLPPLDAAAVRPSVAYQFSSEFEFGGKRPQPENVRRILAAEFTQVLQESGYVAELVEAAGGKNVYLDVKLLDSGTPAALVPAVITGLSLYTIPSWATDNFELTVSAKTPDGKKFSYRLENSATLVQWLPMIFAFPFNTPGKVAVDVRKNIYRNLIIRMQQDGLLPKAATPAQTSRLRIEFQADTPAAA